MTRGLSLNNPFNLMDNTTFQWEGQLQPTGDPDRRLAQFDTVDHGLRAGFKNLVNQGRIHRLNTWAQIIPKYAPPNENDTKAYMAAIVKGTGVAANTPLDFDNLDFLETAGKCFIMQEQGTCPFTDEQIAQAISEALN